ncbi:hypothetical protein [Sunxiuqinia sp. sy24]|uniref:hypothetical protein n=1 Tax=Sunxiuqinia sp. sy24 TaxID=3461495 RepID=UPI0040463646
MLYAVKYTGPFGFIKPWTAVRDSETYSQQFLTPSIVAGIERKLFPELLKNDDGEIKKIVGHRLSYKQVSQQQEQIQPRGWNKKSGGDEKGYHRPYAILVRGVFIEPVLWVAFGNKEDAQKASGEHICLCRNEDMLYPDGEIVETTQEEFDSNEELFAGFELVFERTEESFLVGYNRLKNNEPMYGYLKVVGTPVKSNY